jgi:hypothetical protein
MGEVGQWARIWSGGRLGNVLGGRSAQTEGTPCLSSHLNFPI